MGHVLIVIYDLVTAAIRAALIPFFGDTEAVSTTASFAPAAIVALLTSWMTVRSWCTRRGAPDIPAEPLVSRPPEPPTLQVRFSTRPARLSLLQPLLQPPAQESTKQALAAAGIPNPLRHVLGAPVLDYDDLRRVPSSPLWEARVMGGQRVVFDLLGDTPSPGSGRLQLAAFAIDAEAWPTEAAYAAGDDPMPPGTLVLHDELRDYGQDPRPLCVMAMPVSQAQTDADSQRAIAALKGGTLVVVGAPPGLRGSAVAGGIIEGTFWLCGRVLP